MNWDLTLLVEKEVLGLLVNKLLYYYMGKTRKNKPTTRRIKNKSNKIIKKNKRCNNKQYYGGTIEYKIIGRGYKVKVLIKIDEPRFVYKVFEPSHDRELSTKQCEIQNNIERVEETTTLVYVKIPKLFTCVRDSTGQTILKMQRIYNIMDTDINSPTQPTNILLLTDDNIESYNDKIDKPLNYITQFIDETRYNQYVYQLGQMFGILNFLCQIKTDDVEIVFGKLRIDGPPKLFVLDFDQCVSYNLEKTLEMMTTNIKYAEYDFDILGRKQQMTLNKLSQKIRYIFNDGYMEYPRMLNLESVNLAKNILKNY